MAYISLVCAGIKPSIASMEIFCIVGTAAIFHDVLEALEPLEWSTRFIYHAKFTSNFNNAEITPHKSTTAMQFIVCKGAAMEKKIDKC